METSTVRHLGLRRIEPFRSLGPAEFDALVAIAAEHWLEPGDVLFREGDLGDTLAIVAQGEVAVSLRDLPSGASEVAALGPGALVGEGSFADPGPRAATAVAAVPSAIVEIDRAGFERLAVGHPVVAARLLSFVLTDVARKLHGVDQRVAIALGEVSAFGPLSAPPTATSTQARRDPSIGDPRAAIEALRACGVPLNGDEADLAALLSACGRRSFDDGEVLSRQGSEPGPCFFVLGGEVEVVKVSMAAERVLAVLGPGSIVGQLALMDRTRRSSTLRARGGVTAFELEREAFHRLASAAGPAAVSLLRPLAEVSARQLRAADRRLGALVTRRIAPPPAAAVQPDDRRSRQLHYLRAAVGEPAMDLGVIEVGEADLLDGEDAERSATSPPPLPSVRPTTRSR